jgi:ankyrin repeat protein
MRIYEYAYMGDIEGIQYELDQGFPIDYVHKINENDYVLDQWALIGTFWNTGYEPKTALQYALASPLAGIDMIKFLIMQGASLLLEIVDGQSDIRWAVRSGSIEKIKFLVDLGGCLHYYDDGYSFSALSDAIYSDLEIAKKTELVQFCIEQRVKIDVCNDCVKNALNWSANIGDFGIVKILLDAGADASLLGWNNLMEAVVFGGLDDLEVYLQEDVDLEAINNCGRTAWLLSLQVGDLAKAKRLLSAGASSLAVGDSKQSPIMYTLKSGNLAVLNWLIELKCDVNTADEYHETPLMLAAKLNDVEGVAVLLKAGAISSQACKYHRNAIERTTSREIVEQLLVVGENFSEVCGSVRKSFTNMSPVTTWKLDIQDYQAHKHPQFGMTNPQEVKFPLWVEMVKFGASAYTLRTYYQDEDSTGAVWCFSRFGGSSTLLSDNRVINIAGEHEDSYDPDFHIYNDVVVYDGQGRFVIYNYPRDVFQPTDFHSATYFDNWIYIIGNLGYPEDRVIGVTPVYRLNCTSFQIEKVITHGQVPGWISGHRAVLKDGCIHISGGEVWQKRRGKSKLTKNQSTYIFNLEQHHWHRVSDEEAVVIGGDRALPQFFGRALLAVGE